jgi:HEAT repeat protein
VIDVCRTVFNSPSLITLMQPLPTHERLRAHNIVKGIMDPFAYLVTGAILLFLISIHHHEVPLFTLCYIVLGMGAVWLLGIWLVNRQYLLILVKTITSRYFSQEEFSLKDESILQAIRNKIATGNELEVISILKMLNSKTDPMASDITTSLLGHSSAQVKLETLKLITPPLSEDVASTLIALSSNDAQQEIRDEAVKALCKTGELDRRIRQFAASEDLSIRKAALSGMLLNKDRFIREMAEDEVSGMLGSADRMDRLFGAGILQEVRDDYCHPQLHTLVTDPDTQIQAAGIRAIGRSADPQSLQALVKVMPGHVKPALQALQLAGNNAVDLVGELLADPANEAWKDKLILLLGRVGGEKAQHVLVKMLFQKSNLPTVIRALYRTRYKADEATQRHMEQLSRTYINYGVELMHMQRAVRQDDQHMILRTSLELEVQEIRDLLLCLFACMFDRVKMNQAKHGLESNINENVANAMEIIELTVRKDIGRYFNTMFESTSLEHRCGALRNLLKELDFTGVDDVIAKVLDARPIQYQDWTKACSLYITRKYGHPISPELIMRYAGAENRMVRETAQFAMVKA